MKIILVADDAPVIRKVARRLLQDMGFVVVEAETGDEVVAFLDHLANERDVAASTHNQALSALLFLFRDVLGVELPWLGDIARPRRPRRMPVVLARDEVRDVLALMEGTHGLMARLLYGTGMRLMECVRLRVKDLDLARGEIVVRQGKGGKDRYVPLAPVSVEELRAWWTVHRNPLWLFPSPGRGWAERAHSLSEAMQRATEPMSPSAVQMAFKLARAQSGTNPGATCHTLRHSYATHLLEEGVSLLQISRYLGHASLDTTVVYTHLTNVSEARTQAALKTLYRPARV